jgi:hypothetical protein
MKTELRIIHRDGKEVLQMRTAYVEFKNMGLFTFKTPTVEVVRTEWTDVPHVEEYTT